MGAALGELVGEGKLLKREDLFVTSKLWNTKHHEADVVPALQHSLAKLGLDYVDLYLIHWPHAFARDERFETNFPKRPDGSGPVYDLDVHFTETWRGMEAAVRAGLAKSIGVSNFNSKQIEAVLAMATVPIHVNQVECHPYLPQSRLLDYCTQRGIVLTAYSPLGSPDAVARTEADPSLLSDPTVAAVAAKYGRSAAQVLIRFHTQRGVVAIPKSKTPQYIAANLDDRFDLSAEDMATLAALEKPFRYGGLERDRSHPLWPFNEPF